MTKADLDNLREFVKIKLGVNETAQSPPILGDVVYDFFSSLSLESFYVRTFGDDISVPSADQLEKVQYGYSWNPKKREMIKGWPLYLFVVATQGHGAFAVNKERNEVVFVSHNGVSWKEIKAFNDLSEMLYCFAILGSIATAAKMDFIDGSHVKRKYINLAKKGLIEVGFNESDADRSLKILGWTN